MGDPVMRDLAVHLSGLERDDAIDRHCEQIAADLISDLKRPHFGGNVDAENIAKRMHGTEDEPHLSLEVFAQLIRHALTDGGLPGDELFRLRRAIEGHAEDYVQECVSEESC